MQNKVEPLIRILRLTLPGVMVATMAGYGLLKLNRVPAVYPQADITDACQSIAGCKNASIKRAFDQKSGAWSIKLMVVAERKVKASGIDEKMNQALDTRWNNESSWTLAGWKTHTTEVRYE